MAQEQPNWPANGETDMFFDQVSQFLGRCPSPSVSLAVFIPVDF